MSFLRMDESERPRRRYCCDTVFGHPHTDDCPRTGKVLRLDPRCGSCVAQIQHTLDEHHNAISAYERHAPGAEHRCDDPIRCSACLAEKATRVTARRAAVRNGAARRAR